LAQEFVVLELGISASKMPLLPQHTEFASRPRTQCCSREDQALQYRLTEYQQVYPGTPAFANPLDGDLNHFMSKLVAPRSSPKLPSMNSTTAYSEYFQRPNSRESQVHAQYPFEDNSYKRSTATPKTHTHDVHRIHKQWDFAKGKKCAAPKAHLTTGHTTCDFWASSYQMAHARGKQKKGQCDTFGAEFDAPTAKLEDLKKMLWYTSSYQQSFQSPPENAPTDRASTAPGRSRQRANMRSHGQLPSVRTTAIAENGDWKIIGDENHSRRLHSSTPSLPVV
jgi:hypothetical protein